MQSLAFSTMEGAATSTGTSTMVPSTLVYIFWTISALWTPTIPLFSPKMSLDFKMLNECNYKPFKNNILLCRIV